MTRPLRLLGLRLWWVGLPCRSVSGRGGRPVLRWVKRSFRDNENNIFVLFLDSVNADASRLPSDESICWLYLARLRSWSRGY